MNIKFMARATLVILAVLMASMIVVGICSCDIKAEPQITDTPDEATIETTTVTMQVTEPTTEPTEPTEAPTEPVVEKEPTLYPEIEYKKLDSLSDAKTFAESVGAAIETLTYEHEHGTYTEDNLELIRKEKVRLEEVHEMLLHDIAEMEEEEAKKKAEEAKKPSNNNKPTKPSNNSNKKPQNTATPDEPVSSKGEYKHATTVWDYLKSQGYSDAVCAGMMGNFMTETGGHTLNIKPNDYSSSGRYYGIAQWSSKYYPDVHGKDLDYQLNFLSKTIKVEFDNFGHLYKKGFDYNDFLRLDNPRDAALAFAKVYERCGSGSYGKRQNGAVTAYNYFT